MRKPKPKSKITNLKNVIQFKGTSTHYVFGNKLAAALKMKLLLYWKPREILFKLSEIVKFENSESLLL